jgi:hypothetical protein
MIGTPRPAATASAIAGTLNLPYLGNASDALDIESLGVVELPNPPRSFCAQFAAVNP